MVQAATESFRVLPHEPHASAVIFAVVALLLAASALLSHASQRLRLPVGLVFLAIGIGRGIRGARTHRVRRFRLRVPRGLGGARAHPVRRRAEHASRHAAPFARARRSAGDRRRDRVDVHRRRGRARAGSSLERVVPARRDRVVHGRGGGVRRAARQRHPAQASRRRHARGGIGDQRSRRGDPHDGAHRADCSSGDAPSLWLMALGMLREIAIGAACGVAIGAGARWIITRVRLPASGLYSVMTLATALLGFSMPTLIGGSGFLGVYVAAVTLGSGRLPYRTALGRIHDSLAWLGQVAMFLMLGLLVYPSQLLDAAWIGTIVGLALAFVARPVVAALCLIPLRFPWNDVLYVGWVGLRGAVPIILAIFPVLAGAPGAHAHLQHRLLHRRAERAPAGGDRLRRDAMAGTRIGRAATADRRVDGRVVRSARRRAAVVLHRRGAPRRGDDARRAPLPGRRRRDHDRARPAARSRRAAQRGSKSEITRTC